MNELLLVLIQRWKLADNYQNLIMPMTVCAPQQAERKTGVKSLLHGAKIQANCKV